MFRKTIRLNSESDADAILIQLRDDCGGAGLSPEQAETIAATVRGPIETILDRGREVAATGAQLRIKREIASDSFSIQLRAEFGIPKPRLLARLLRIFRLGGA